MTERLIPLSNSEVSMTPSRELPPLAIATAIPREVNTLAGGTAAVREGSEARIKAKEKYIWSRTIKHLVDAHG